MLAGGIRGITNDAVHHKIQCFSIHSLSGALCCFSFVYICFCIVVFCSANVPTMVILTNAQYDNCYHDACQNNAAGDPAKGTRYLLDQSEVILVLLPRLLPPQVAPQRI